MTAPDHPATRTPGPSHRMRVGARSAVALISLLIVVGSGLAWSAYRGFSSDVAHGQAVPALAPGAKDLDGADENVLLVGNDSRAGASPAELKALSTQDDGGSVNTDTVMLLHIPASGGKATIVSFPRDSWVEIPGNGKGKLNSAYSDGYAAAKSRGESEDLAQGAGLIMLIRTISGLTGLHIDHYVQINLLGFYRISEAVGGVPVCLLAAQNPQTDSDAYGKGYSGIDLPKGNSVIEGKQALAFVRQRHGLPNGDLDRIRRQQYFLSAAFHKIESAGTLLNPFKLRRLMTAVSSSLLTDPGLNLISLAQQFDDLSSGAISYETLPNQGPQTIYPDGVLTSIVGVDTAAIPSFVNQLQGKPADPALAAAAAAAPSSVTLDVLNGTQTAGLAGQNADTLKARGFHVDDVNSTDGTAATTIEYPAGQQGQAKAVSVAVPGAQLLLTDSVAKVTLVVGANGVSAKAAVSSSTATASSTAAAKQAAAAAKKAAAKPPVAAPAACIN